MGDYAFFGILEIWHSGASLNMRSVKGIVGQRTALAVEARKGVFALLKVWNSAYAVFPTCSWRSARRGLSKLSPNFEPLKSPRIVSKTTVVQNIEMLGVSG